MDFDDEPAQEPVAAAEDPFGLGGGDGYTPPEASGDDPLSMPPAEPLPTFGDAPIDGGMGDMGGMGGMM